MRIQEAITRPIVLSVGLQRNARELEHLILYTLRNLSTIIFSNRHHFLAFKNKLKNQKFRLFLVCSFIYSLSTPWENRMWDFEKCQHYAHRNQLSIRN